MCDECFPPLTVLSYEDFCTQLCNFRMMWSDPKFWEMPFKQRDNIINEMVSAFGVMEGDPHQINNAGSVLRATIVEYKLRNGLRLLAPSKLSNNKP
jgi:hypothetical protein